MSMESSEIVRRNEAIARFMGLTCPPTYDGPNSVGRGYCDPNELRYHEEYQWLMPVVEKISLDAEVSLTFRPMGQNLKPLCYASAGQKSKHSYMDGNLSPIETIWRVVSDYCLALEEPKS